MAVRLLNLHRAPLRIDLRGGSALVLRPGQQSDVLREELLYDNVHLAEWERAGWMRRIPARLRDDAQASAKTEGSARPPAEKKKTGGAAATRTSTERN
jgi:hypothetical protein